MHLTFATRPSALARWQTGRVIQRLQAVHPGLECSEYLITSVDDDVLDGPSLDFGRKGRFTHELKEALRTGKAHATVQALKDLPVENTSGTVIASILERDSAHDVLVSAAGRPLTALPEGARVGTGSLRRAAQLLALRSDLKILPLRGDVHLRLQKIMNGEYDAIVLAQAALTRLGLQRHITEVFSLDLMLPAPGQGALAVQCRADDIGTLELLRAVHHPVTAAAVDAERAFCSSLGGGGSLPLAAYAENDHGMLILTGAILSRDGKQSIRLSAGDTEPHALGKRLASFVLERGAAEWLKARV